MEIIVGTIKQIVNNLENGSLYSLKIVKDLPEM